MYITSINNGTFIGSRNVSKQVQKIINRTMGQEARVSGSHSGFTVKIPGRAGSVIAEDHSAIGRRADHLALARDFSLVHNAIKQGILKSQHVTKIGL